MQIKSFIHQPGLSLFLSRCAHFRRILISPVTSEPVTPSWPAAHLTASSTCSPVSTSLISLRVQIPACLTPYLNFRPLTLCLSPVWFSPSLFSWIEMCVPWKLVGAWCCPDPQFVQTSSGLSADFQRIPFGCRLQQTYTPITPGIFKGIRIWIHPDSKRSDLVFACFHTLYL